jgi:hypothetical protein
MLKELVVAVIKKADLDFIPASIWRRDPIAEGIDFIFRQRREGARVFQGLKPGVPVVRCQDTFVDYVREHVVQAISKGWASPDFYCPVQRLEEIQNGEAMAALEHGLRDHKGIPVIVPSRDLYVANRVDYFLCKLHLVVG